MMDMSVPDHLAIRPLEEADCAAIAEAFAAQGWNKPKQQYEQYLLQQSSGQRTVLVATVQGEFAGYATILWSSEYPPFKAQDIPEIADFNVLIRYRKRGIGTALMDEAERRIAAVSPTAGIGVGLTGDYGAAQRLYVKRGYILDGRGLYKQGRFMQWGDSVTVDDDLILCLTKPLRAE